MIPQTFLLPKPTCHCSYHKLCRAAAQHHQNGILFPYAQYQKGRQKDAALCPLHIGESHFLPSEGYQLQNAQSRRSDQRHHCRPEASQHALQRRDLLIPIIHEGQQGHYNAGGKDTSEGSNERPRNACDTDSYKGGRIHRYRSRRHLGNGNQIREFIHSQPSMLGYYLTLNQRHGRISPSDAEHPYLQKAPEQLKINHLSFPPFLFHSSVQIPANAAARMI